MRRFKLLVCALTVLSIAGAFSQRACYADPVVKLRGEGMLESSDNGLAELFLVGQGSHLGKFVCFGEIEFMPGEEADSLVGIGVVVIAAANGDILVGVVIWESNAAGQGVIGIPWRDSVTLSDGTTFESTGRFRDDRPGGAVSSLQLTDTGGGTRVVVGNLGNPVR